MSHNRIHSLSFYINMLMLVFLLLFASLIIYNNQAAFRMLRQRVYSNTQDTVVLYQKEFDNELKETRLYLSSIMTNNSDFTTISRLEPNTGTWSSNVYQLTTDFQNATHSYTAEGFFIYRADVDHLIYATASGSDLIFSEAKQWLSYMCTEESTVLNQWALHIIEDRPYLVLIMNRYDSYIGCFIPVADLFSSLSSDEAASQLFIVQPDGTVFDGADEPLTVELPSEAEGDYLLQYINGVRTFTAFEKMQSGNFYLARFVPYSEIVGSNRSLYTVILIVLCGFLLIWSAFYLLVKLWLRKPVEDLTTAIEEIQTGELGNYIPSSNQPFEFHQLSHAFNDMLAEIRDLKIDIYEKIVENQQLEIQYLKQQITPHFMINCLNTVYSLMDTQHSDLARRLLSALSVHLRYTLSSGQTVPLREELALVENYIELSSIRYPDSVKYCCECDPSLGGLTAIPLLILNFVENTIKYEVSIGQELEIHVNAEAVSYKSQPCLHLVIWDSGRGFSPEVLEKINRSDFRTKDQTSHIGIFNVIQRARHVYPFSEFLFDNRPEGGARIDIYLSAIKHGSAERK